MKPRVAGDDLFRSLPREEWERLINSPEFAEQMAKVDAEAKAVADAFARSYVPPYMRPMPRWL